MNDDLRLLLTKDSGAVEHERVPRDLAYLHLSRRGLVDVSDRIAELTAVTRLELEGNQLRLIPDGVLAMKQLAFLEARSTWLSVSFC